MHVTTEAPALDRELSAYLGELNQLAAKGVLEVPAIDVMNRLTDICIDTRTSAWQLPGRAQEILQKARDLSGSADLNGLCGKQHLLLRLVTRHLRESLAV
ncbi:MAG TPA: hypothetical protein VFL81_00945 [Candidatus Saccharimonadales bacterium]|nr:hypothetical protein [Candidatus Saccharimonadales bacterium]